MIELLIIKGNEKGGKVAEYKEYVLSNDRNSWVFIREMNNKNNQVTDFIEWHTKTLYPYSLNLKDFTTLNTTNIKISS